MRYVLPSALVLAALAFRPAPSAAATGDHQAALAALHDLRSAIAEIVRVDQSYSTDRNVYHQASQRAINALEGAHGPHYAEGSGSPGDTEGAIGHIDRLLDRKETPVWADPLRGAEVNMRAAVAYLMDSKKARELMDYQLAVSRALAYLEVAEGRPTEPGVLGGLEGVLANTVLGVPDGARQEDGCGAPSSSSTYGTHNGYLAWITISATPGTHTLPENLGGQTVAMQGDMIVLHTAAAPLVAKACADHAQASHAAPQQQATTEQPAQTNPAQQQAAVAQPNSAGASSASSASSAESSSGPPPALYTMAQAEAGAQIFASKCTSCHGVNLQGTAAPSVAGTDFLNTAKKNGWTLAAMRYLIFTNMPFNAPGTLSPKEYANVTAFFLASNCYPAGNTPFPTDMKPEFSNIKIGPLPGEHPGENKFGVCPVK